MRKLLKIILPPFVGFLLYFWGVRYSPGYFDLRIEQIGTGTVSGFEAYYKYALPLLFTVAVLTQLLIVIPIWRRVRKKTKAGKITAVFFLVLTCLLFASGLAYAMWAKYEGLAHLVKLVSFMTIVQMVYWAINLVILYLLD